MTTQSEACESAPVTVAPMAPDVVRAHAVSDGTLTVEFADGRTGTFDVSAFLAYPAFAALNNPAYFKSVFVAYGTVCWPEGEDFSPETLAARIVWSRP